MNRNCRLVLSVILSHGQHAFQTMTVFVTLSQNFVNYAYRPPVVSGVPLNAAGASVTRNSKMLCFELISEMIF